MAPKETDPKVVAEGDVVFGIDEHGEIESVNIDVTKTEPGYEEQVDKAVEDLTNDIAAVGSKNRKSKSFALNWGSGSKWIKNNIVQ